MFKQKERLPKTSCSKSWFCPVVHNDNESEYDNDINYDFIMVCVPLEI